MARADYQPYGVQQFIGWYAYGTGVGMEEQTAYGDAYGSAGQAYGADQLYAEEATAAQNPPTDHEALRSLAEALEIYAGDVTAPGDLTDEHLQLLATYGVHVETDLGMPPEDD
ncbi:hypothetical protein [Streptomyces cyaneofuscatus]|uniref:hypothetical protein n=1 Tax=Streptomyces cyaneofuscatus TaxID=66883 RepID=UPI00342EF928